MIYHLPKSPKLTDVHEDLLQQQTILEGKPGTILFDFNTLLNFIGAEGILVTGTHLLPMKQLSDLNARLTHPIQHGLSRPQQKSYPHINGLYLLVRASGLTQIEQQRNKPRLVIDQEVFPSWANLNVTERYFTLLESWLLRGRSEIVGERGGPFWHDAPIIRCLDFFHRLPAEGVDVKNDDEFRYYPSYHNLALLELFGLISIQRGPVVAGQGWQITHISPTPLGEALLALLANYLEAYQDDFFDYYERASEIPFGQLQELLQLYFPEWQNNLRFPENEALKVVYIFKVALGPQLWRRIALPGSMNLDSLSSMILQAYNFDDDQHFYRFSYPNRFGEIIQINCPAALFDEERRSTKRAIIENLPLKPGSVMTYLFDFLDNWTFTITLERIDASDPTIKEPFILESEGQAPKQYDY
jgi:hypothetical protein